jgi:stage IV sporulation protein A
VVGPVRTGKSTFIRRFMEIIALPQMDPDVAGEMKDQLPVSGSGKQITTVEPKFIPKEACEITLGDEVKVNLRLIDCVGYLVKDAVGNLNEHKERLVKTPWFSQEIPFEQAAEYGTRRVIFDHATIGLVITSDGSFGEIPREQFAEPEERTIQELKKLNKPFLVLVNSRYPFSEETTLLVKQIQEKQQVMALSVNCEQLRKKTLTGYSKRYCMSFPFDKWSSTYQNG